MEMRMSPTKSIALGAGLALLAGMAPEAHAFPVFVVNECVATAPSVVCDPALEADQFAISYSSQVLQTTNGADNPFTQFGSVRILDYELADIAQPSFLNTP